MRVNLIQLTVAAIVMALLSSCNPFPRGTVHKPSQRTQDSDEPESDDSPDSPNEPTDEHKPDKGTACRAILDWRPPKSLISLEQLPERFLKAHNRVRRIYGLPPLSWDDSLATYAQAWADHLKATNRCRMIHRSKANRRDGKSYGENLAWNWISHPMMFGAFEFSPERVVRAWSKECKDYDYETNSCTPGEKCGHFTQIVWRTTKRVGCGMAICDGAENKEGRGRGEIWVCNYHEPGNIVDVKPDGAQIPRRPF